MIPTHWRRSFASPFPGDAQTQVLTAIFATEPEARLAFSAWRRAVDLQGPLDPEIFCLLPLLYLRVREFGIEDDLMPRLKGVYRHAIMSNLWLLHETEPAVGLLEKAGVPTLLLKGAALALTAYVTPAARPMADIDVAIPKERLTDAIRILEAAGWRSQQKDLGAMSFAHAAQFRNSQGGEFDLHWHILLETSQQPVASRFWETAKPLDLNGITTRMLDPALALVHVLIHGLRANPVPPVRWVADGLTLIRQNAGLDWDLLVTTARAARLTQRVHLGLNFLVERFAAPVPSEIVRALSASRRSLTERLETVAVLTQTRGFAGNLAAKPAIVLSDYLRCGDERGLMRVPGFARYVWRRFTLGAKL